MVSLNISRINSIFGNIWHSQRLASTARPDQVIGNSGKSSGHALQLAEGSRELWKSDLVSQSLPHSLFSCNNVSIHACFASQLPKAS